MKHLWQIDHPYYGAEGYPNKYETFAELREDVDALDEDMNHVYRWDWQPVNDDGPAELTVFTIMPRKGQLASFSCPVSEEQEAEVLEWLRGPRVLGALRKLWEPLLDGEQS